MKIEVIVMIPKEIYKKYDIINLGEYKNEFKSKP